MELLITARNLELNDSIEAYIQKKFAPLGRRLRGIGEAKVEIQRQATRSAQDNVVVQVTLSVNGTLLRAQERAATVNAAVDVVAQALDRQVMRYKERHFASLRAKKAGVHSSIRASETEEPLSGEEPELVIAPSGSVVRVKRFAMKPLSVEDAAEQMEFLGHEFFFFINAASNQYNVIYRRRDGDYTVIEPER
ncbi:MAG: ribosome-associated translation inhibitor RaiA [Dehalococcoidia bacterium]|nr:ribosome-associated translation inhibitor RaiA [Dehalococcoidia bacterium]